MLLTPSGSQIGLGFPEQNRVVRRCFVFARKKCGLYKEQQNYFKCRPCKTLDCVIKRSN